MSGPPYRLCLYNGLLPNRNAYIEELLNGINQFEPFAHRQADFQSGGKYRCLCSKCKNRVYLTSDEMHLMYTDFVKGY